MLDYHSKLLYADTGRTVGGTVVVDRLCRGHPDGRYSAWVAPSEVVHAMSHLRVRPRLTADMHLTLREGEWAGFLDHLGGTVLCPQRTHIRFAIMSAAIR